MAAGYSLAGALLLLSYASWASAQYLGGGEKRDIPRSPLSTACPGVDTDLVYVHVSTASVIGHWEGINHALDTFSTKRCVTACHSKAGAELRDANCTQNASQRFSMQQVSQDTKGGRPIICCNLLMWLIYLKHENLEAAEASEDVHNISLHDDCHGHNAGTQWYQLRLVTTDLCWQAIPPAAGQSATIRLQKCSCYSAEQLFTFTPLVDNLASFEKMYELSSQSPAGMCVRAPSNGAPVQLLSCSTTPSGGLFVMPANSAGFAFGLKAANGITEFYAEILREHNFTYHTPCASLPRSCDSSPDPVPYRLEDLKAQDSEGLLMCAPLKVYHNASGPCARMDISSIWLDSLCAYKIVSASWRQNDSRTATETSLKWSSQQFDTVTSIQLWQEGGQPIAAADDLQRNSSMQLCIRLVEPCVNQLRTSVLLDSSGHCCPFSLHFQIYPYGLPAPAGPLGYAEQGNKLKGTWKGSCRIRANIRNSHLTCSNKPDSWSQSITAALHMASSESFAMMSTFAISHCPQQQCAALKQCQLPATCVPNKDLEHSSCRQPATCDQKLVGVKIYRNVTFSQFDWKTGCLGFDDGSDAGQFRLQKDPKTLKFDIVKGADPTTRQRLSMCTTTTKLGCSIHRGKLRYNYTCTLKWVRDLDMKPTAGK